MAVPFYTRGSRELHEESDMPAIVAEFEKERDNLDVAFTGVQAAIGATVGSQGAQGGAGTAGAQGSAGAAGAQGSAGAVGAQGSAGSVGPQGNSGGTGPQGAVGGAGAQGSVGSAGAQGYQGDQSYTPSTGADWVDPDPTTVAAALDRIASAVAGLLAAPIP
jgi:hypothetical protein